MIPRGVGILIALSVVSSAIAAEEDSSDVVVLTKDNFDDAIKNNEKILVEFYAPWCGHCKSLEPEWNKAATALKGKLALAKVDATVETDLAEKFKVGGFPTIYFFRKGRHEEYSGGRTESEIVAWVEENTAPALKVFKSDAELQTLLENRTSAVTAFIATGGEEMKNLMTEVSEEHRTLGSFVHVEGGSPSVRLVRGLKEEKKFGGDHTSKEALATWFKEENLALVGQIDESNYEAYLEVAQQGIVWLCFTPQELKKEVEKHMPVLEAAADKLKAHKLKLVWLDTDEYEEHAKEELSCDKYPTVVFHQGDLSNEEAQDQVKKYKKVLGKDFTAADVAGFVDSCMKGDVEPIDDLDELDDEDEDEDDGGEPDSDEEKEDL